MNFNSLGVVSPMWVNNQHPIFNGTRTSERFQLTLFWTNQIFENEPSAREDENRSSDVSLQSVDSMTRSYHRIILITGKEIYSFDLNRNNVQQNLPDVCRLCCHRATRPSRLLQTREIAGAHREEGRQLSTTIENRWQALHAIHGFIDWLRLLLELNSFSSFRAFSNRTASSSIRLTTVVNRSSSR